MAQLTPFQEKYAGAFRLRINLATYMFSHAMNKSVYANFNVFDETFLHNFRANLNSNFAE